MSREDLHFRLRIPPELKIKVEAAAENQKRSMTAEIIDRLEETFRQDEWLPQGCDYSDMIGEIEEEIHNHRELQERFDREYGFDRFDAMKDEILQAIKDQKK